MKNFIYLFILASFSFAPIVSIAQLTETIELKEEKEQLKEGAKELKELLKEEREQLRETERIR